MRCGRCGFRGTAMSGSIPFRGFRDRLLSLPSFHTCQKKGRDPISSLRLDTLLFGLFSGLAPHPVDPLSAGRRTDLRRRVRVSEHLSAGLGCASTPEVFCLPHGVTPSYLVWRNGGVTRAVTPLRYSILCTRGLTWPAACQPLPTLANPSPALVDVASCWHRGPRRAPAATSKNQARGPRRARFRGDRAETGAP